MPGCSKNKIASDAGMGSSRDKVAGEEVRELLRVCQGQGEVGPYRIF